MNPTPNDPTVTRASNATPQRSSPWGSARGWIELAVTVLIAAGLAFLVQAFIVKPYRIPSKSMQPTLQPGQRILVDRLDSRPALYSVVVFHPPVGAISSSCGAANQGISATGAPMPAPCDTATPAESSSTFVKRVVGLGGDTLRIKNGLVYRNGVEEKHSFITPCVGVAECTFSETIKVPKGDFYMMGDNRGNSDDSRYWGPIPSKYIIGKAFFTYWPIDRIGIL